MVTCGAIVLRGGQSRRMGRPKDGLDFGGETLLARVVGRLGARAGPIVVVSANNQDPPMLSGVVIMTRDAVAGRGPLEGLAAGLRAMPDGVELVYATGVDAPFLDVRLIELLEALIGDHDLAIPWAFGHYHPLAAVYRKAVALPAVEKLLSQGKLRLADVTLALKTRVVIEAELRAVDPELASLRNINTPEDYSRAFEDLKS